MRVVFSAILPAAIWAQTQQSCYPDYQCIFRWQDNARTEEYSWDIRPLCRPPGQVRSLVCDEFSMGFRPEKYVCVFEPQDYNVSDTQGQLCAWYSFLAGV
jgi:hypothetical protein